MDKFEEYCNNWKGKLVDSLSVSYGLLNLKDYPNETLEDILKKVDSLMYKNKSEYYTKHGIERRKQN